MIDIKTIRRLDRVSALFTPKVVSTLRKEAMPFYGKRLVFEACWEIESGSYEGQMAFIAPGVSEIGWVPSEDLSELLEA